MLTERIIPKVEGSGIGSPRDVGVGLGSALRDKITAVGDVLYEYESFRVKQPWWMPYSLFKYVAEYQARWTLEQPFRRYFPKQSERLDGMAEGAEVSLDALYLYHAFEAVMTSLDSVTCEVPLAACTAIAARGRRTTTGHAMVAHNFDNVPLIGRFFTLREIAPDDGLRSLQFTFAPLSGTVDGINEAGLCITYNYAMTTDNDSVGPPVSFAIDEALCRCTNVREASELIMSLPRCGGAMLMLADAEGQVARLELSSTRSAMQRPRSDGLLFHTNQFRLPRMREMQVSPDAVYAPCTPDGLRGRRVLESPERRDDRLSRLLNTDQRLSEQQLAAWMSDHGDDRNPDDGTVCMHGEYWSTTACLQMFPEQRRLRVSYGPACEAEYVDFSL